MSNKNFKAGDIAEVRSKEEILRTLDQRGQLDGLPFMPQMFQFCGKRVVVGKRAHKTCDTVNDYKGRRMKDAVHLDGIRCDGQAYGGCQALCLIYWKEVWLKRPTEGNASPDPAPATALPTGAGGCTEADVLAGTQSAGVAAGDGPTYVCHVTQVPAATSPLDWWDVSQYLEDYTSGNATIGQMARGFIYMGYRGVMNAGIGLGRPLRWLYDRWQTLVGGIPYPRREGTIPVGSATPMLKLDLKEGELVRVKSYKDILATLDQANRNRGLYFDAEMVPFCGSTRRVLKRVDRIVNERTGKLQVLKNPCVILDGVVCEARYSECRLFCPRAIYSYWRETWLERAPEPAAPNSGGSAPASKS